MTVKNTNFKTQAVSHKNFKTQAVSHKKLENQSSNDRVSENKDSINTLTIYPGLLAGSVTLPISKSLAHRVILAKALSFISKSCGDSVANDNSNCSKSCGDSVANDNFNCSKFCADLSLDDDNLADDIKRTLDGAKSLIVNLNTSNPCKIFCKDSGTTLRMILPIACTLYDQVEITVTKDLAKRPLQPLIQVLKANGCNIHRVENSDGTFTYHSQGKFTGSNCTIAGNVSSQYISGLLYALPLTENGGEIHLTTTLTSKPYLEMTFEVLKDFGIQIQEINLGKNFLPIFKVCGKQHFKNLDANINQGDWSSAAFFAVANGLGSKVEMKNLDFNSLQGDKAIYEFIEKILTDQMPEINLEDYPDLFPILAVLASYQKKTTTFTGISRLKLKESDRIASTTSMLKALHGNFTICGNENAIYNESSLDLDGSIDFESFTDLDGSTDFDNLRVLIHGKGRLKGGIVDSFGDHRIVMAAAIAATIADGPVTILNSNCYDKSYPDFFKDFKNLGGKIG